MPQEPIAITLQYGLLVLLLLLNALFVAAEYAFLRVGRGQIEALARKGSGRAQAALDIVAMPEQNLRAAQLGITITTFLLGWFGAGVFLKTVVAPLLAPLGLAQSWMGPALSIILGVVVLVSLHAILGEMVPRALATKYSETIALWLARPLWIVALVLRPAASAMQAMADLLVRLFGVRKSAEEDSTDREAELRVMLSASERTGAITADKRDLLENVFDLSKTIVRHIMVPRTEVAALNLQRSLAENLIMAERTAHSRYPLIDGDPDHVVGVIHMKDLFWQLKEMEAVEDDHTNLNPRISGGNLAAETPRTGSEFLRKISRDIPFVPETMRVDLLLEVFRTKRVHMAMVVDEYGGTSGMVTFENVIEEIVGDVQDEFDEEAPKVRSVSPSQFVLDGTASLYDVNLRLGTALKAEDVDTISGYLMNAFERMPHPGESLVIDDVRFTIREVLAHRIIRIHAELGVSESEQTESADSGD